LLQAVLDDDPDRFDALIGLGLAHDKLGAWDEAIDVLTRAAALAPRQAASRLFLGLANLQPSCGASWPPALRARPKRRTSSARHAGRSWTRNTGD